MLTDEKLWLGVDDIRKLFECGSSSAYSIIRQIKAQNGGGKLGRGKILRDELEYWIHSRPDVKK